MAEVKLENITKRFKYITALDDVSFRVSDGEFFVLLGPTGAGKTTSLRVIAGLEKQDIGSVEFDNQPINELSPAERDVAFVFQQYSLYPTMSVFDNLAFPLRSPMRKTPKGEIDQKVRNAAEKLRISHLLDRKTAHLSGGEMQRVSIGRAIVRNPRMFLMDEPLSNLDAKLRESLRVELQHIQKTEGTTTLYVTHDQVEALTMADRIAVMKDGKIVQIGTPQDIYDRPETLFVAQLVGTPRINLLSASIVDQKVQILSTSIQVNLNGESVKLPLDVTLGIRPEDVIPSDNGIYEGEVALVEPLGIETIIYIKNGEQTLLSAVSGISNWQIGENIRFDIVQERLLFFDKNAHRVATREQ